MVRHPRISQINNVTFTFPSSPLLTQYNEIAPKQLCNHEETSQQCANRTCECVHIEQVPLDDSVEIILMDNSKKYFIIVIETVRLWSFRYKNVFLLIIYRSTITIDISWFIFCCMIRKIA